MSSEAALPVRPALPSHRLVYATVLDLIGDTPLVEIRRLATESPRARVFGKLEPLNPGGSVKDRVCLAMFDRAEQEGLLAPGGVVVEPTSGNTGIGLALVAARRGYRCILTMPESMSLERRQLLEAYGAEVILTPEAEQMEGAIKKALEIVENTPLAFMPQQFDNPANPGVHMETTAQEILSAMRGEPVNAFVAAVGTGGTISGVGPILRRAHPRLKVVAVEPESCATISRGERGPTKIQGIAAGFVPGNYNPEAVSEVQTVTDREAYDTQRALALKEGLLVGISSGANVAVALRLARKLPPTENIVTVLCDTGERYFSLDEYFRA